MKKNIFIANEQRMLATGAMLAKISVPGTIIFLEGELGAGKTTLTRGYLRALGYEGIIKSPTYTLVESYSTSLADVHHFDFYRLHDSGELLDMGLRDYLTKNAICLIEWPSRADDILPEPTLYCTIEIPPDGIGRQLEITATSKQGEKLLHNLEKK